MTERFMGIELGELVSGKELARRQGKNKWFYGYIGYYIPYEAGGTLEYQFGANNEEEGLERLFRIAKRLKSRYPKFIPTGIGVRDATEFNHRENWNKVLEGSNKRQLKIAIRR